MTSTGLVNSRITNLFLKLLDMPISEVKVIFVPTAARTEEELKYVEDSKLELLDIGIMIKNINVVNLDIGFSFKDFKDYDLIYVCGGNTFYLLKKIRESGFDKVIAEFVKHDKLYFGVSAGSILVCPNISIAAPFDENDIGLRDLSGLNLVDVLVSPHYSDKDKRIIEDFRKKSRIEVVPITDNQALFVNNGKKEIIE